MKELVLNGRTYLSTKRAAEVTGYTTDYVGQLARGGKVDAQLVGRNWYISEDSITKHKFGEAKVNIRKEIADEKPAPALEVLVESAEEEDKEIEESIPSVDEEVAVNENVVESGKSLEEMENVWQEWYKAQRSVPDEGEEVFINRSDVEESEDEEEAVEEEVSVPITRVREISRPQVEEVAEDVVEEHEQQVVSTPQLPAQRSWGGTGLVVAAVLTVVFVGGLAVGAEYVLAQYPDMPVANVYQGFKDYLLGIQRVD